MKLPCIGALALAAALSLPAAAQTGPTATDMQILAQKVKADKKLLVAVNMQLTDAEAKGFWPVYEGYQRDLEAIDARLLRMIAAYAEAYNGGPVPNDTAKQLLDEYLGVEQDEVKLKRSYVPRLSEVLPGAKVARYVQVETKIRAIVRYELAAQIPLVQ
ncbi:MAG TPA: hypothetical protein VH183_00425 [Burkholderiaceae bacterium]|jgi:hypothetical protein|nr:hypothetical protein [Burkholderiaceae bacterium]